MRARGKLLTSPTIHRPFAPLLVIERARLVEGRGLALVAIAQSMRQGSSKSPELLALERKYADLEKSFTRVAVSFATSVTSTAIRYARLGIKPCAIIRWASDKSYAWKWLSPQLHREEFWTTIEDIEDVPADSPTGEVLESADPSTGVISKGSTTAAWFRYVGAGTYRDILLTEHAMSLGRFGALTMLVPLDETLRT